jgi:hypothetical protein
VNDHHEEETTMKRTATKLKTSLSTNPPAAPGVGPIEAVRAHTFEVVDKAGRVRAALGVSDDGATILEFLDERDRLRLKLQFDSGDAAVLLFDRQERQRLMLLAKEDGSAAVVGVDAKGENRIWLGQDAHGSPALVGFDGAGKHIFEMCQATTPDSGEVGRYLSYLAHAGREKDFRWVALTHGIPASQIRELWRAAKADRGQQRTRRAKGKARGKSHMIEEAS